jgi:two-component system, cell cycle response regulator DivK
MKRHALVIDDNANNLEVLSSLLAGQGISCSTFNDPTIASAELQSLPKVDLVFCDLEMPKVDGYEMLRLLRARFGKSVPILTYSAHHSEIDVARRMGFDGFLGKPLDADRFPTLINRILNGQSVWELP